MYIERLSLASPEAKKIITPYGYVLIELLQLNPNEVIPVFDKLPEPATPIVPAKFGLNRTEPSELNDGWGNRGLTKTGHTLRDPVKTTYVQEFRKLHAASIRRVLKPSDNSIKQL